MGLKDSWKFFYVIAMPFLLAWIPFVWYNSKTKMTEMEGNCIYIIVLMISFWTTNALSSVPVALLPVCLVPFLGVEQAKTVAFNCMTEQGMLLCGQTMLSCGFMISDLHKRMALKILSYTGNCNLRLVTCIFFPTLILSIVMSAPAATMIMCATVLVCVQECSSVEDRTETEQISKLPSSFMSKKEILGDEKVIPKTDGEKAEEIGEDQQDKDLSEQNQKKTVEKDNVEGAPIGESMGFEDDSEYKAAMSTMPSEPVNEPPANLDLMDREKLARMIRKRYFVLIYTAANIGGLAFPYQSSVMNLFYEFADPLKEIHKGDDVKILTNLQVVFMSNHNKVLLSIPRYLALVFPVIILVGLFAWIYLSFIFTKTSDSGLGTTDQGSNVKLFGKRTPEGEELLKKQREVYKKKLSNLGSLNAHQILIILFVLPVFFLWIFRDPRLDSINLGWSTKVSKDSKNKFVSVGDSTVAILFVVVMFCLPRFSCRKTDTKPLTLLSWKFLEGNVPWGVLITMGGQSIISKAAHTAKLSMKFFIRPITRNETPSKILPIISILGSNAASELWGGFATCNFITPVYAYLSQKGGIEGKFGLVALSSAVASSLCFMLPVATPTNLMVFWIANGDLTIIDMIKYGVPINIVSVIVVIVVHYAVGSILFVT